MVFVELPVFTRVAADLFGDDELRGIQDMLLADPEAGDVIPGGGGLRKLRVPLPGRGTAPLHVVPVNFVIDATHHLAHDERAVGRTFHLVDPCPLGARHIYEKVAQRAQGRPLKRDTFSATLARALLRVPGLERVARTPLAFLEQLDHYVFYNCRGTLDLLEGSGIACPPFETYVDNLVRYVREVRETRNQQLPDEEFDPLD